MRTEKNVCVPSDTMALKFVMKEETQLDLQLFFAENPRVALAFSGGVDSAYLLYAAIQHGANVHAYFIKTAFQPEFERRDAMRLAAQLGADITVIEHDVLQSDLVAENPADRCYHCKHALFALVQERALLDGYHLLIDGTNASDDAGDRPGMRALRERSVRSPLRECGLTKPMIRQLSKEAGLFTWDKPAYACLATRIPTGDVITHDMLARIEGAEEALFALGFTDFRVRVIKDCARLQLPDGQVERLFAEMECVRSALEPFFSSVLLDLNGRS